jgi:hypothetical protein
MLLFSDETGFCLHPKLGRIWSKRGTQPVVLTKSQHHKRLNIFGWVDPLGGKHGMVERERGNTVGFLGMLRTILYRYKTVSVSNSGLIMPAGTKAQEWPISFPNTTASQLTTSQNTIQSLTLKKKYGER